MAPGAAALARAARWFAPEPPETVALAADSLRALALASPRPADPDRPNPAPLAWLDAALERLERCPEPLPIPPHLPRLPWRYLVFVRLLCDGLEAAHGELRRRGIAARCPLTDAPDPFLPPRAARPARERSPEGLGALVAGLRLPEAGVRLVLAAHAAGVPWADAAAFWRQLEPAAAPDPAPAAPPAAPASPEPGRAARADPPGATAPPAAGESPLDALARAALAALVAAPDFNRHAGNAWLCGGALYVAAQALARELHAHPWIRARPELHSRKALYRQLAERRLIEPDGAQRIWPLWVCEDGQPDPRYVSALKMSPDLAAGHAGGDAFRGWLRPATGREIRAFRERGP